MIKQVEKKEWELFLQSQKYTLFTQSPAYGAFYGALDEPSWIFGIYEEEVLVGGALVIGIHARRGDYLYLPYGPVLSPEAKIAHVSKFLNELQAFAKKNTYDFVRFSPFVEKGSVDWLSVNGVKEAPMHALAEHTWLLPLNDSEDALLANMNKNHRNLIRRCERDGVEVRQTTDKKALERLNTLLDQTAKKHGFVRFPEKYINAEFQAFVERGEAVIFEGYLPDGRLDASAIIMFYGNMACYRHSGSLSLEKRLPTSYLIQWRAIKEAKKRGMTSYNFWGIAPSDATKKHPFFGITHFKKGFGGQQLELAHAKDIPVSKKYLLTWLIESLRRIKRGF